ncbi:hypothetical protein BJX65DRAFT_302254 [Aspergillus insuetus]
MHLSPETLSLLALLPISLALPDNDVELGYLKCASAVIKTTHFPECTSSYKLDCFCEAAGGGSKATPSSGIIATTSGNRAWVYQLPPETEEICASFGVPRGEIPKYLCNDDAVPVSPRRGSTPMGRVEKPLLDCEEHFDGIEESSSGELEKRAIPLEGPRLLIPEHEPAPAASTPAKDDDANVDPEDPEEEKDEEKDQDLRDDRVLDEKKHAVYEVVTVTKTETRCSCAETATADAETASPAEESESEEKTSGALHGTHAAVATPSPASEEDTEIETETETETKRKPTGASSSVRVPSSPVGTAVAPTGVDAEREDEEEEEEDEEQGEKKPAEEMFHGGAVSTAFSKSVGVLIAVVAGFVLL